MSCWRAPIERRANERGRCSRHGLAVIGLGAPSRTNSTRCSRTLDHRRKAPGPHAVTRCSGRARLRLCWTRDGGCLRRRARAVLVGRGTECAALDRVIANAHHGQSGVLVLRGEAGIGKSALMEYAVERAEGCRVLRAVGVEWEMELPFAGLHQLCVELLEGRERLPAPQGEALATAFGLSLGCAARSVSRWARRAQSALGRRGGAPARLPRR